MVSNYPIRENYC